VYVIDFIGAGKSSRALVRKGRLKPLVATGTAGLNVTVSMRRTRRCPTRWLWLGSVDYKCDAAGKTVPAVLGGAGPPAGRAGPRRLLLPGHHRPPAGALHLTAGIHADRESLLAGKTASIVVRPALSAQRPAGVDQAPRRGAAAGHLGRSRRDRVVDGGAGFQGVRGPRVGPRGPRPRPGAAATVTLTAKVKSLSAGKTLDLAAGEAFALNMIDHTDKIEDVHLNPVRAGLRAELLGRTGEAKRTGR